MLRVYIVFILLFCNFVYYLIAYIVERKCRFDLFVSNPKTFRGWGTVDVKNRVDLFGLSELWHWVVTPFTRQNEENDLRVGQQFVWDTWLHKSVDTGKHIVTTICFSFL